jgi:hypothetical protein
VEAHGWLDPTKLYGANGPLSATVRPSSR